MDQIITQSLAGSLSAASWPQYRAADTAATQAQGEVSFASELASAQAKVSDPVPLAPPPVAKATTPPAASSESAAADKEDPAQESAGEIKIARSWRMEQADKNTEAGEDDDFTVDDLIDLVNPLQHIPIVGTIYRELTGDTIKPDVQVTGSIIFGALTGNILLSAAAGVASAMFEQSTGKEPTLQVAEALFGTGSEATAAADTKAEAPIMVAQAQTEAQVPLPAPASTIQVASAPLSAQPAQKQTAASIRQAAPNATTTSKAATNAQMPMLASVEGMRVGNVIYTSPLMRSAAKVAPAQATKTAVLQPTVSSGSAGTNNNATSSQSQSAQAGPAKAEVSSGGSQPAVETTTALGAMMQDQVKAHEAGNPLPPELVRDMMIMALDKYKAAQSMAPASAGSSSIN